MPLQLTVAEKEEIFLFIEKSFGDMEFDKVLEDKVKVLIERSCLEDFTSNDLNEVRSKKKPNVSRVLTSTILYLVAKSEEVQSLFYSDFSEMERCYPFSFQEGLNSLSERCREKEKQFLLSFRNILVAAFKIIQPKGNILFLLEVIGRLDGSNGDFTSGSGQNVFTQSRRTIIDQESQVIPATRTVRKRNREEGENSSSNSVKRVKKLNDSSSTHEEEVQTNDMTVVTLSTLDSVFSADPFLKVIDFQENTDGDESDDIFIARAKEF
eukprot:gene10795-11766_t